jgi:hypothetical protein
MEAQLLDGLTAGELPPHAAAAADVAHRLGSHLEQGLSSDDAAGRLLAT